MYYLDYAATTDVAPEVFRAMEPFYIEHFGNPSALYAFSDMEREGMEHAREQVAALIHAKPEEIFFTAGGTEADNWALKGRFFHALTVEGTQAERQHFITTRIEHHAVLHTAEFLETLGARVTYLPVDWQGNVDFPAFSDTLNDAVTLVSVMMANNEVGTVMPIKKMAELAGRYAVPFHTDAVQAVGQIPIDVQTLNVDMLSASAHKLHGPKGCGFLYIREGTKISPILHGGGQERGLRAGTENVPAIVGLGKACELAAETLQKRAAYVTRLREYFIRKMQVMIPQLRINGARSMRLPGNISVSFARVDGGSLLSLLDGEEIYASAGSACNAKSRSVSHVLSAMQLPEFYASGTLRFTLSDNLTFADIDRIVDVLKKCVLALRRDGNR